MTLSLPFEQVDVFVEHHYQGNALAVVVAADELTTEQMQAFARWTQLSETTFLLHIERVDGTIWVGGAVQPCISGRAVF